MATAYRLKTAFPILELFLTAPQSARHLFTVKALNAAAHFGVRDHGRGEVDDALLAVHQGQLERKVVQNPGVQAAQRFAFIRVLERGQQVVGAEHHAAYSSACVEQRSQ